jgi:tripartite-type tricarboxylate transporter receptor subunit TctC
MIERIVRPLMGLLAMLLAAGTIAQTTYPDKPIHMIVGFPPGSQPDIVARLLSQKLTQTLGTPVLVENVSGAGGGIAAEHVAKAVPDGSTIGLLSQTHLVINPTLHKLAYDPARDFAPISQVTVSPYLLVVNNAVPATTVKQLVALANVHRGELTVASSGSGTGAHIAAELFNATTGVAIRHIPYKGVVAAIPDLLGGRVSMMFSPIPVVLPLVREGKLRALAVTSLGRSGAVPDVPTVAECGYPEFEATNWYALVAPARTRPDIVRTLYRETAKVLALPEVRDKLSALGSEVIGNSPEEFAAVIKSETPKWARVIKDAGIRPDQ